jgi:YqaJ-like viral recombinase domain
MTLPTSIKAGPGDRARRYFVGGSDARIIMGTDEVALVRLWREKRGEAEPPDYSDNLIVQLGAATEPVNRRWFEKTTGHVIKDVQTWVCHPVVRWMAATLDGIVEGTGVVEDLDGRADHLEKVFAALRVYHTAIIPDTAQDIPAVTLNRRYLDNLFQDIYALCAICNAAEEMREHENWRAS